jgi:signal transduction histidine kinase
VLENAILASPEGGFVELRVGCEGVETGWLAIDVVDRGCGMPPAVRDRAFEPFFGARSGGRGLGLAIARDLVESMGGRIEIGSHPGRGTRVRVVLRRAAAEG